MANPSRATIINKLHKVLKKHFKPVAGGNDRSVVENLLYAHCLQNVSFDKADAAFTRLRNSFFDWNEVRVTTVAELAEVMQELPDALQSATNIKRSLQSIFEGTYSFDLESLKKQNIGKAVGQLRSYAGVTEFAIAYVTQHSLEGHAVPLDQAALDVMYIVGAIDEGQRERGTVPGLERTISKKRGVEFATLLHQVAADLFAAPLQSKSRDILLEVAPDGQSRLPKKAARRRTPPPALQDQTRTEAVAGPSKEAETKGRGKKRPAPSKKEPPDAKKSAKPGDQQKTPTTPKSATKQLAKRKPR